MRKDLVLFAAAARAGTVFVLVLLAVPNVSVHAKIHLPTSPFSATILSQSVPTWWSKTA